jgi:hypothetical protein
MFTRNLQLDGVFILASAASPDGRDAFVCHQQQTQATEKLHKKMRSVPMWAYIMLHHTVKERMQYRRKLSSPMFESLEARNY